MPPAVAAGRARTSHASPRSKSSPVIARDGVKSADSASLEGHHGPGGRRGPPSYKPYTGKVENNIGKMGSLKPDLQSEELLEKRKAKERVKVRGPRSGHARPAPRTPAHTRAARAARGSSRPAAGRLGGRGGGSVGPDGSARARALMAPPGCPAALLEEPQDGQPADHRRAGGVRAAQEAGEARYAPRRRLLPRPHRIGTEAARPVCCVCRADQSREGQAVRGAGAQATAAGGDSARSWRWAAGRDGRGGGLAQPARAAAR